MLNLLEKCQHIYKLLIHEQWTYHCELCNAQIHWPRKYMLGNRVFARVQVQSKKAKRQVMKLAYRTQVPYKITKLYPSGSYDQQSLRSPLHVIIKKHGADLYPSPQLIKPLLEGTDMGLISEAGLAGIADPGAAVVELCHKKGIQVIPHTGASSIILALIGSGFNGQQFTFHGYLPID